MSCGAPAGARAAGARAHAYVHSGRRPEMAQDGPKMGCRWPRDALTQSEWRVRPSQGILGTLLGPSWAVLGLPWPFLGGPRGHLEANRGPPLGFSQSLSWPCAAHLGAILGHLGPSANMRVRVRTCARNAPQKARRTTIKFRKIFLELSWAHLGSILAHLGANFRQLGNN